MRRTLIAGFGNALRGDDGFGVAVIRRLGETGVAGEGVELLDVGTGGIRLAQELLAAYDRLIVVDAMTRGGRPGALYVLTIDAVAPLTSIDMHLAIPARALSVARALGALPAEVLMVGCEPADSGLSLELSEPVRAAVESAVERIRRLLEDVPHGAPAPTV